MIAHASERPDRAFYAFLVPLLIFYNAFVDFAADNGREPLYNAVNRPLRRVLLHINQFFTLALKLFKFRLVESFDTPLFDPNIFLQLP